jgi:hypothetical protein
VDFDVNVDFNEPSEPNTNEVDGTIMIDSPGWKGRRPFTASIDTGEENEYTVVGTIDNNTLLSWGVFWDNIKTRIGKQSINTAQQDSQDAHKFYHEILRDSVIMNIKFPNNKPEFSILHRNGQAANKTTLNISSDTIVVSPPPESDPKWILPVMEKWIVENPIAEWR